MKIKKFLSLNNLLKSCFFVGMLFQMHLALAANRTVDLVVSYKTVNLAGKPVQAIVTNDQIPGPTLHFKEGDHVTINVFNHLDKGTTIHWHGLIIPWNMDGVENVSQAPIPPGGVFHYQFTLKQAGTYWYHGHTGFQEQQGLAGALIIDPIKPPAYHYDKEEVIFLSDWSNTKPEQIYANLKKNGDYYSPDFPLQPSLVRFLHDYHAANPAARKKLVDDYKMMQQMRMSIYDFSDVAYDGFLLNGHPNSSPWTSAVSVGDVVRLRFIGAGASTIFHVKIPGTSMRVVQMQGHDVVPYAVEDFTVAPGETLDALVKITKNAPYIIYAESSDTLGAAKGALITQPQQTVDYQDVAPFPTPQPATMMAGMSGMDMSHDASMNMSSDTAKPAMKMKKNTSAMPMQGMKMDHDMASMDMSNMSGMNMSSPEQPDSSHMSMDMGNDATMHSSMTMNMDMSAEATTTSIKYQNVKATVKTNDPNKPFQVIKMELSGYMDRYIWFINGVPEMQAKPIMIEPGKRYRLVFVNNSMMHHPMHIHGHWFILRNGHGAFDPLLHTIDVAPGETVVADIDADASGQWIFHCHFLYHMMGGMTRVFRYTTFPQDVAKVEAQAKTSTSQESTEGQTALINSPAEYITHSVIHHPMGEMPMLFRASYLDTGIDPFRNIDQITFKTLLGGDYNKLELYTEDAEIKKGTVENADMDFFYWHLISEFWAIKGGMNYFYRPSGTPYWQPGVGVEGLMPYFIDTNLRTYYHSGSTKFDLQLSRDTQITNRFFIRLGIRSIAATKTVTNDEIGNGLNQMQYIFRPYYQISPSLALFTEYNHTQDYGSLTSIRRNDGESTTENTLALGVSLFF